jgi:hypothetical protein
MPFDSNGQASVAGNRPVNGQDTDAAQINVPLADIQSMLSQVLLKSGVAPMTGNFNMNGFKISNIGEASNDGDLITLAELNAGLATQGVPTGSVQAFRRKTAPTGWVIENGGTIGSAASGATTRANADTLALYSVLWAEFTNTELPIQTSAGAASTRGGSAAADFTANKRMPLFDSRTRFLRGSDEGLAFDATLTVGASQADAIKSHTHTGTTDSAGLHTHNVPDGGTGGGAGAQNGPPTGGSFATSSNGAHTHPFTTAATGIALETRGRSSVVLYCIKL